jgi:acyl carrier protein
MTDAEIRAAVIRALKRVAPEADAAALRPDVRIREQVEIDSMDFLNFVIELDRELGVDVPESDYAEIDTLDKAAAYLSARVTATR